MHFSLSAYITLTSISAQLLANPGFQPFRGIRNYDGILRIIINHENFLKSVLEVQMIACLSELK